MIAEQSFGEGNRYPPLPAGSLSRLRMNPKSSRLVSEPSTSSIFLKQRVIRLTILLMRLVMQDLILRN